VSLEQFGYKQELRRALSLRDLIIFGMIFMVPIAPFAVFGFVWQGAKGMVALAYLLGLAGMFFTALSYASMSRAFPVAGSVYAFVQRGLHEGLGFFSGWLILLDYILVPALLYVISAVALRPLFPGVPPAVWLVLFVAFNAAVNLVGVELSARVNRWMLVMELAVLAIFMVVGLYALYHGVGAGHLTLKPLFEAKGFSLATVASATSIAVLSFLGFDGISTLAEESSGGLNAVGRATVVSLILVGALFMLQTWLAADLSRGMNFSALDTAFYEVAQRAGGDWLRVIVIVASVLASAIANAMAAQSAVARVLYAMARDGKLPAVFAKVHPRFKTPYISTLFVAALSLLIGTLFAARVDALSSIVNFGALTSFVLLHIAVIRHYFIRQRSGAWLKHLVFPLVGMAIILYVLFEMDRTAKWVGAIWLGVGILYYLGLTLWLRRSAALEI
jgi:amino acid transporter